MWKYDDFIGKSLNDVIKYMPDNIILHIGSRSGFVFVENGIGFYLDIKKINSDMIKFQESIAEKNRRNLYCEIKKLVAPNIKTAQIKTSIDKIRVYYDVEITAREYIKKFIPLEQRKILEIYPRLQKDTIAIIVDGPELGKYWDLEEYKKGRK